MSKPYVIADVGGNFTINGLPAEVSGATAMAARLVTLDSRLITEWVAMIDAVNGNDWASNIFVAHFDPDDFLLKTPNERVEIHIKATVSGVDSGYRSASTISVEYPV